MKSKKAEAVAIEKKKGVQHNPAKFGAFAEQWLQNVAVASFTARARAALQAAKVKVHKKDHALLTASELLAAHSGDAADHNDPECMKATRKFLVRIKWMLAHEKLQKKAKVVVESLRSWQGRGRICVALRKSLWSIRHVQRWWRRTNQRLKRIREELGERWAALEYCELLKEHAVRRRQMVKQESVQPKRGRKMLKEKNPDGGLNAEDYVKCFAIPAEVRNRFLTEELRARRFFLLPRLALWEEENLQWQKRIFRLVDTRVAQKTISNDTSEDVSFESMFSWPSKKPSCLPGKHPSCEAMGVPCTETCLGRGGDQEILDMVRRCREHWNRRKEGGWRAIPCRFAQTTDGDSPDSRVRVKQPTNQGGNFDENLFGEDITDADLREFNIDPDTMPCLAEGAESPAVAVGAAW